MKYRLVIFDMDGTILNTLEDLKNSLNFSLAACSFPPRTLSEVRSFVGNGIRKLIERGVPAGTSEEKTDEVYTIFNQHYSVHCADNTKPYDGISDTIKLLRSKGFLTAVVSNKADYAVQSLCKDYFDGLFDCAVGAVDGMRKKPYPDSVNLVLDRLNISRSDCVYVGDTEVDLATAENSGMDCIAVDWGFRDRAELLANGAKIIISSAHTLLELTE